MFKFKNEKRELKRIIEAILLVAYEPVKTAAIEKVLNKSSDTIEKIIKELQEEYRKEDRGFQLKKVSGGYRFYTHPDCRDYIENFFTSTMRGYFSQAALEVLAIIVYNQPVSRITINEIRGVRSESVISTLLSKRLIEKASKGFGPGHPILYKTTPLFLESYGLNSLKELPPIEKFSEDIKNETYSKEENSYLNIINTKDGNRYLNVIAIDGPAGSGKSTISKELSRKLKFFYLYTGAMYRALAYLALKREVNLYDEKALTDLTIDYPVEIKNDAEHNSIIKIDGEDVTNKIFTNEVSDASSKIAIYKGIRKVLSEKQREICEKGKIVVEGRDSTTVVCPYAIVKIFLGATPEERTKRRVKQLIEMGQESPKFNELLKQIKERDERDKNREIAPLVKTEDSVYIDSTNLTVEEVTEKIIDIYRKRSEEFKST